MNRAKRKGPYINLTNLEYKKQNKIQELSRKFEITPQLIGSTFKVHNGKDHSTILITEEMVGYKIGEFVSTRARFEFKKKKKK